MVQETTEKAAVVESVPEETKNVAPDVITQEVAKEENETDPNLKKNLSNLMNKGIEDYIITQEVDPNPKGTLSNLMNEGVVDENSLA